MSIRSQWYRLQRIDPGLPARAGHDWTAFETESLQQDYLSGVGIDILAPKHRRTRYAIASKLADLGFLQYEGRTKSPFFTIKKGPRVGHIIWMKDLHPKNKRPISPRRKWYEHS